MLTVVGGICLVDVGGPVVGECGVGHIDPVTEWAGGAVVHGHQRLVEQEVARARHIVVLGYRPAGEVPGGAVGAGRPVHIEGTRLVGVLGDTRAPFELQARVVRVAAGVPCHRRVAARLEVLAGGSAIGGAADEAVRDGGVGPGRPTVGGVGDAGGRVTAAVVVVASDDVAGVERVHRHVGLA